MDGLLSIVWTPTPEIFTVGSFTIRWYGLFFALSFLFGYLILLRFFRKEGIPVRILDELTTYMVLATIIGARLGHVFFYDWSEYKKYPFTILKIWEGGLASHGAAIGIILALLIFSRVRKKPFLWVMDRIVVVVALAGFMIRMGNLMNSEIYGNPTDLPWGFQFIHSTVLADRAAFRHPTQIYEGFSYLVIFLFLFRYYWRMNGKPVPGRLFGFFLISVFGMRFLIEFIKMPQAKFEIGMVLNMGQRLSVPLILAGIWFLWRSWSNGADKRA